MLNNLEPFNGTTGQTKEDFLYLLGIYYIKSPIIKILIEKFGLYFKCSPLDEELTTEEVLKYLENLDKNKNKTNKQTEMKKANTATNVATSKKNPFEGQGQKVDMPNEFTDFVNFTNAGDQIEGFICGAAMIPSEKGGKPMKRFLIIDNDDNETKCLPANYQLSNKLNFLEQQLGGKLSSENSIPVRITFEGKIPHPQEAGKEISQFEVLKF